MSIKVKYTGIISMLFLIACNQPHNVQHSKSIYFNKIDRIILPDSLQYQLEQYATYTDNETEGVSILFFTKSDSSERLILFRTPSLKFISTIPCFNYFQLRKEYFLVYSGIEKYLPVDTSKVLTAIPKEIKKKMFDDINNEQSQGSKNNMLSEYIYQNGKVTRTPLEEHPFIRKFQIN